MGRTKKMGLSYFPFDVATFSDIKIRKLIRHQGGRAITVYALLLCYIYKNGYYMTWDEELPFIISESSGYDMAYVQAVINDTLAVGLFDKELFDGSKVLTSYGIQKRYQEIMTLCRRSGIIEEYDLISERENTISSEEKHISSEVMPISSEENAISSEVMPISSENFRINKRKEKEKESIEKKTGKNAARFIPPSLSDVSAYIRDNGLSVDASRFIAFYTSNDWRVGKNKMSNWKASVYAWDKRKKTVKDPEPEELQKYRKQQQEQLERATDKSCSISWEEFKSKNKK